jgi:hypothetical protein
MNNKIELSYQFKADLKIPMINFTIVGDVVQEVAEKDVRKQSDAGASDTSTRIHRFHMMAQNMKSDVEKSRVTRQGKKLIIEQPTHPSAGSSFDLSKKKKK